MRLRLAFVCLVAAVLTAPVQSQTEQEIRDLVGEYNVAAVNFCNAQVQAAWNVETNVGETIYQEVQVRYLKSCTKRFQLIT